MTTHSLTNLVLFIIIHWIYYCELVEKVNRCVLYIQSGVAHRSSSYSDLPVPSHPCRLETRVLSHIQRLAELVIILVAR